MVKITDKEKELIIIRYPISKNGLTEMIMFLLMLLRLCRPWE